MGTHMKTTIEIAPTLLKEAKRAAAREGSTLRALVEEGLRSALETRRKRSRPFQLKLVTVRGQGLQAGLDWELPRDLAYDLPDGIAYGPKRCFQFPFQDWLQGEWREIFSSVDRTCPVTTGTWYRKWCVFVLEHWLETVKNGVRAWT